LARPISGKPRLFFVLAKRRREGANREKSVSPGASFAPSNHEPFDIVTIARCSTRRRAFGGEFRAMRDWIDQLRFVERVVIVALVAVIMILEIVGIPAIADLGKVVFENAVSASWW
jgi:hypothetical protein